MLGAAHAATEEAKDDHGNDDHGEAPAPGQGAIYMAPDNHVLDDAHHAPKWVKVSPFIAMLSWPWRRACDVHEGHTAPRPGGLGALAGLALLVAAVPWYLAVIFGALMAGFLTIIPYGFNKDPGGKTRRPCTASC